MVNPPKVTKARCSAVMTARRSDCGRSPRYHAATSDPQARPKLMEILLKRAGYRARHARLIRLDVRIGHAVHAGKLQRIEKAQSEANGYDRRQRRVRRHQRVKTDGQADQHRVDDQHFAISEMP
jgi:hypothetical protein